MSFSSKKKKGKGRDYECIGDRRISAVATIDNLVITFKKHLLFERNIDEKVNKTNFLTGSIQRLFVYLKKEIF